MQPKSVKYHFMWPKFALYPEYWVKISDGYAKGLHYLGDLTNGYCRPFGMGILELKKNTYYVGEFQNGQAYGRGFLLKHKKWTELKKYTVQGTYEEVMATAEFDSCGRVIHCEPVYHTKEVKETMESMTMSDDGMWSQGTFQHPIPNTILLSKEWSEAMVGYSIMDVYRKSGSHSPRYTTALLSQREEDGSLKLENYCYCTVYDNLSLLVLSNSGAPFRLEVGKEHVIYDPSTNDSGDERMFTFTLGKDYKRYIDLQRKEWKANRMVRPWAMETEHLYTRALASLVFTCDMKYRPESKEYTAAILQAVPEARLVEDRKDGTQVLALPDDTWTICPFNDHTWLYSPKTTERIRITGRNPEEIASIATQAHEIWKYINDSL